MMVLQRYRLVAEQGKLLTNGEKTGYVVDLAPNDSFENWTEINEPVLEEETQ